MELERMELGRSAALVRWRTMLRSTAIAGAEVRWRRVGAGLVRAAGWRAPRATGSSTNAAKFCSTLTVRLVSLAPRSERSAEFARVNQLRQTHACARGAIERCWPAAPPAGRQRRAGFFFLRITDRSERWSSSGQRRW